MHCSMLHSLLMSSTADMLAALQMTMTAVMGAATTPSTTEVTMVMAMASTTTMEAQLLQQPLLGEVQLLPRLLLLAGTY